MPFPGEHSARQHAPGKYDKFRRKNDEFGDGIDCIYGIYEKDGKTVSEVQSIRFDAKKFTAAEAKKWLKDHDYSTASFEKALGEKEEKGRAMDDRAAEDQAAEGRVIFQPNMLRFRDAPILDVIRHKRSNNVPEGALVVPSFASTEEIDFFNTRVTRAAMDEAWPGYMSVQARTADGALVLQGNLRYMHDSHQVAGYCRHYERREKGYLAYDTIPASKRQVQQEILDGLLTGTSMGFNIKEWNVSEDDDAVDLTRIAIAERSVVDSPATPDTSFLELAKRARHALGDGHIWSVGRNISMNLTAGKSGEAAKSGNALPPDSGRAEARAQNVTNELSSTGGRMAYQEENGFLWKELRPESDFVPGTLRYGEEDLTGIVLRGGTLTKDAGGGDWAGSAVQSMGFNSRGTNGWNADKIDIFMAMSSYFYWNTSGVALETMPEARSRGVFARLFGGFGDPERAAKRNRGKNNAEDAVDDGDNDSNDVDQSDVVSDDGDEMPATNGTNNGEVLTVDEKTIQSMLEARDKALLDSIGNLVRPIAEKVNALETAEATRAKAVKDAEDTRVKAEAATAAKAAEEARIKAEVTAQLKVAEEERKKAEEAARKTNPRSGAGAQPASANVGSGQSVDELEAGLGVLRNRATGEFFDIRDIVVGGNGRK